MGWISPVLNSPSGKWAKKAKINRGQNFPCMQYLVKYSQTSWNSKVQIKKTRKNFKELIIFEVIYYMYIV